MKIKSITVTNFKSCPDGTYNLSDVNVLLGKNGKGKTSLQMALRYLLSGKLPEDPIRHGADSLCVSAILDNGQNTEIVRETFAPELFQIDGKNITEKDFLEYAAKITANRISYTVNPDSTHYFLTAPEDAVYGFLSTGKIDGKQVPRVKTLAVTLNNGTIMRIRKSVPAKCLVDGKKVTAKALEQLLQTHMACNMSAIDITTSSEVTSAMEAPDFSKYLLSILPVTMNFDQLVQLSGLLPEETDILSGLFPAAPAPISVSDVSKAYKALYETRTAIGRQMKELEAQSKYNGATSHYSKDDILKKLAENNKKLGAADELEKTWKEYQKQVAQRNVSIDTLRKWVKEYNDLGHTDPVDSKALEQIQQMEDACRRNIELTVQAVAGLRHGMEPLEKMLKNLDTSVCPLCEKLVCNTDKTACKNDIIQSIQRMKDTEVQGEQQLQQLRGRLTEILQQKDTVRKVSEKYAQKVALYGKIQELQKSIPAEPTRPQELPNTEGLRMENVQLQDTLQSITLYEKCMQTKEQYQKVKDQYVLYSSLLKKTDPKKGVLTNTILDFMLAPFRDHVNTFAKSVFSDTEIAFVMEENGLAVKCKPHERKEFLPLKALSDGERMLAVFALMDMVSSISGTRMVIFDRMECMDADTIDALLNVLVSEKVKERYDHILIAAVNHEDIENTVAKYPVNTFHF